MRSLVAVLTVISCGGSPSPAAPADNTPAPAKVVIQDAKTLDVPKHDVSAMTKADAEAPKAGTQGTFTAKIDGAPRQFAFLPTGVNAATWVPATGVARVQVGATANAQDGYPYLRISLEGARLDQLELPKTFTFTEEKGADGVHASITYEIADRKIWNADTANGSGGSVTLESFYGTHLTGTFNAKLVPRSTAFGPPITVTDGTFSIDLRLRGFEARTGPK